MSFEDSVRRELERAGAVLPVVGIDIHQTLSRGRSIQRHRIMAATTATAAVAAIALAGSILLTSSPQPAPRQDFAGPSSSQTTSEETLFGSGESEPEEPAFERAEPVLREWLAAIQDSDEDLVWAMLTPEAQAAVGRSEFDRMMESDLPEGLGAFAGAQAFHYIIVSSEGDRARVVGVASGVVTRESSTEFAAMAIPMVVTSREVLVDDAFIDRARYYDRNAAFASASLGPQSYGAGDELIVEFAQPAEATEVYISVDDDRRPLPTEFDPSTGRATATLDRNLPAGRHIATVVVVHSSGRLYPQAIVFEAAE